VAKVRELEAEAARLQQAVAAKEQIGKLTVERDRLQSEVDKRDRRAVGKGVRFARGFKVSLGSKSPTTAA
jgi:hypothetical protein